jgi:small subunit ribosomal protein S17
MPRKKDEETTVAENGATEATEDTTAAETQSAGAAADADAATETAGTENTEATEAQETKSNTSNSEDAGSSGGSIVDSVVGAVASAVSTVASGVASTVTNLVGGSSDDDKTAETGRGNRAERIGTVTSDKMTKTVVVRVDRLVKHPKYRKYVRRKKQFMAHDELGATIGDKVRIIETRPLSARKRWRVIEIVQKAAK